MRITSELTTAAPLVPDRPTLPKLTVAAAGCRACPLWKSGTQTVFGEGQRTAKVMFVGEQPGNDEDLAGRPFVGPAGRLLDRALEEAGIDRAQVYVTNVVKHFKWEPRGKRRIHKKPSAREIAACRPWLDAELEVVKPQVLVCLGASAAQALLGREFRVSQQRGQLIDSPLAPHVLATVHPSSILRAPDDESRRAERKKFIDDLKKVSRIILARFDRGHFTPFRQAS
ncbi:MAG: UdgX family uracil-DNA binding protein [Verrucomicrobia subdivision 3 bacterium]|nr:UdgX family uracil-DNA binding protein [Limisphaerales bacterium]